MNTFMNRILNIIGENNKVNIPPSGHLAINVGTEYDFKFFKYWRKKFPHNQNLLCFNPSKLALLNMYGAGGADTVKLESRSAISQQELNDLFENKAIRNDEIILFPFLLANIEWVNVYYSEKIYKWLQVTDDSIENNAEIPGKIVATTLDSILHCCDLSSYKFIDIINIEGRVDAINVLLGTQQHLPFVVYIWINLKEYEQYEFNSDEILFLDSCLRKAGFRSLGERENKSFLYFNRRYNSLVADNEHWFSFKELKENL